MEEILEILEKDSRYSIEEIAVMTGKTEDEVKIAIKDYEDRGVIAGYTTLVNWENTNSETVTALIEVKIIPQRGVGFDKVAERIYNFREVKACYLMSSGGFDLTVIVEGKTMKEVSMFVSNKLAIQEYVNGTATHFVLKKYKDHGTVFKEKGLKDDREVLII
ncbi:MAG: Lrp/AsnC family transcriptional regulator [Clostridium perfringens]|nr:Lrp/AsnC family transcriptional regulator [Clostridium perfringens]